MKGIIIYKTKYGSTLEFAQMLKENFPFELCEFSNSGFNLDSFDIVILCGSLHGGKFSLKGYLTDNWNILKRKKVILMITSGAANKEFIMSVMEKNLNSEILENVKMFPVGGRYILKRFNFIDRTMIRLVAFLSSDKDVRNGMLEERDNVKRGNLNEIINYTNRLLLEK